MTDTATRRPDSQPAKPPRRVTADRNRVIVAVSLAHLFLLSMFEGMGALDPFQASEFLFGSGLSWFVFVLSATLSPLVVGAVLWLTERRLRRASGTGINAFRQTLFLVTVAIAGSSTFAAILRVGAIDVLLPGANLRFVSFTRFVSSEAWAIPTAVLVASAVAVGLFRVESVRRRLTRIAIATLLIMAPWTIFSMGGSLSLLVLVNSERSEPDAAANEARLLERGAPTKVVMVIFDALAYGAIFDDQEIRDGLDSFRELASHSLVFHEARAFSGGTKVNVPVIVTGQAPPEQTTAQDQNARISESRNLFDVALEYGYPVVADGFYIQYCSRFVGSRGRCSSNTVQLQPANVAEAVVLPYLLAVHKVLFSRTETAIGGLIGPTGSRLLFPRIAQLERFHERLLDDLRSDGRQLRYAHYMIPHKPYWKLDPESGELLRSNEYLDSVLVVDRYLGQILDTLREAGRFDDSLVVVLADHGASTFGIERVPLIVKLPGLDRQLDFAGEWDHSLTLPLLESLLAADSFDPSTVLEVVRSVARDR